jgi:rare lipoprotein A
MNKPAILVWQRLFSGGIMQFTNKSAVAAALMLSFAASCMVSAQTPFKKDEAIISWYGDEFHGRPTSSGEIFDMTALTAAHKNLPFGTILEVTNLANGKKVSVRVNDRGPFVEDRELDVSKAAAQELDIITSGTARASIVQTGTVASPAASAPAVTALAALEPAADKARSAEPVLSEKPVGVTWRIQLGSFTREENATRLVVKLRSDGFSPAFEKTETMTRVVLAAVPDAELAAVKEKLAKTGYRDYLVRQESW